MSSTAAAGEGAGSEAVRQLLQAAKASKCWPCGCLHESVASIERSGPPGEGPAGLEAAVEAAKAKLVEVRYDCLGCPTCFPAMAINALERQTGREFESATCATAPVEVRAGWPPLPGAYTVLRYRAPVAVCTLADDRLSAAVAADAPQGLSVVGTMQTENLGIERLVRNIVANPNLRFLVLCGEDSHQSVGHRTGQSLLALVHNGLDERSRIVGARGRRPVLRNVGPEEVEHFRKAVEVVDLVGVDDLAQVIAAVEECARRDPGPALAVETQSSVTASTGYLPARMVADPAGYFVVYVDTRRHRLSLEHFSNDGVFDAIVEGETAAQLYTPAVANGLVSRLDHAAYLGRELARAEAALASGQPYVQDSAPERRRRIPMRIE